MKLWVLYYMAYALVLMILEFATMAVLSITDKMTDTIVGLTFGAFVIAAFAPVVVGMIREWRKPKLEHGSDLVEIDLLPAYWERMMS